MSNDAVSMRERVGDQIVVGDLQEGVYRRRFVAVGDHPVADGRKSGKHLGRGFEKEAVAALRGPFG